MQYTPAHLLGKRPPLKTGVVSVIITHKNRQDMLDPCLATIRAYFKGDVVIVDDRSSKPVEPIAQKHSARLINLDSPDGRLFHKCLAINTGVYATDSEFIYLNDVDCLHPLNVVHRLLALHATMGESVYYPTRKNVNKSAKDIMACILSGAHLRLPVAGVSSCAHAGLKEGQTVRTKNWSSGWGYGMFMSRKMFDLIGGFDENMAGFSSEDADFSLRVVKAGFKLTFTRAVCVYHVNHGWMAGWGGYGTSRIAFRQKHGFWGP